MKKSLLVLLTIVMFFISINCFAFGNSTTNNNIVAPVQGQTQAQAMLQAQSTNIRNNVAQANAQLNKQTNTQINGQLNNQKTSIVFEDVREYVQTADIKLPVGTQGYNESKTNKGRRYISPKNQIMVNSTWSVKKCKLMLSGNSFNTKVKLNKMVEKGEYPATDKIKIYTYLPVGKYIEIALAPGNCKGGSNSALITAKTIIKGAELGANILVIFDADAERRYKYRGIGSGAGIADATNKPDTVLSGITSFNLGSSRYEFRPYQFGYLLKEVK